MTAILDTPATEAAERVDLLTRLTTAFVLESERWLLWFPAFLAMGTAVDFGLSAEPPLWSGPATLALLTISAVLWRARPFALLAVTLVSAPALGFAAAQWRTEFVSA